MNKLLSFLLLTLSLVACRSPKEAPQDPLLQVLYSEHPLIKPVVDNAEKFKLQVLFTQIDRDSAQRPHFTSHAYRLNADPYFYPASTVKFPAALLALEKLNRLNIDPWTPMLIDSAYQGQSAVTEDATSENGLPSVAHYSRKIFLVSDNDAFNRLYELIGQGPFNQLLHEKGYKDTRIVHRLSIALSEEENAHTNPVWFATDDSLLYEQEMAVNDQIFWPEGSMLLGKGEMKGGELIAAPKDFAHKNFFPLDEQQLMLRASFFPEFHPEHRFDLSVEDYQLIYRAMGERPRESDFPHYPDSTYYDGYVKFFLYGDTHDQIPSNLRIFNKVGLAYGFLTDNAYIVDFETGTEFLLSATLWTNENQIFNDDQYEYDEIGFPFLAELGRQLYEYEKKRPKAVKPDLSRFQVFE